MGGAVYQLRMGPHRPCTERRRPHSQCGGERFRHAYELARSVYRWFLASLDGTCSSRLVGRINLGGHLVDDTHSVLKRLFRNFHCQAGYHSPQGKSISTATRTSSSLAGFKNSNWKWLVPVPKAELEETSVFRLLPLRSENDAIQTTSPSQAGAVLARSL
jgi:hypothetical protein